MPSYCGPCLTLETFLSRVNSGCHFCILVFHSGVHHNLRFLLLLQSVHIKSRWESDCLVMPVKIILVFLVIRVALLNVVNCEQS